MVAEYVDPTHAIVGCLDTATTALTETASYEPVFMSIEDKRKALLALSELRRRADALQLRLLAASGEVADADGARDVATWVAHRTQAEARPLRAEQRLAEAIDQRWTTLGTGMTNGRVSLDQAQVIVRGLEALPDHLGGEVVDRAETQCVEWAQTHTPTELRLLLGRILEVVAPEIAEAEQAKQLEREEQRARDNCRLSFKPMGDGSTRISGQLPDAAAQRLQTYLHAYTNPRKAEGALTGEEDRIPYPKKLAQAFCALLEHLDPTKLPQHGGTATSVLVTIGLDSLEKGLATGSILGGQHLSATEVRRLACTAKIIPAVLGGKGEILDLGRSRRLFSPAQRIALALRAGGCQGEGCDVPAAWTEAHHLKPWSEGGETNLDDAVAVCNFDHHRLHDPRYTHEILPNGKIRFTRRH